MSHYKFLDEKDERDYNFKVTKRTYYFKRATVDLLEDLSIRFSDQAGFPISFSRTIDMALQFIKEKNLRDLLPRQISST